ncbi:MAG: TIGR02452 family protein [Clostridiales bacterium]|nr:TIGR02452 family protein [Clostridiales bacterium]
MNYYANREQATAHARQVAAYVEKMYPEETHSSVKRTVYFPEMEVVPTMGNHFPETEIIVQQETTVDAIFREVKESPYVCALNFASYKDPGGRFLDGSTAQEESLCHEGNLYNILSSDRLREIFYSRHKFMLNRGLYHSDMLYSPDILFIRDQEVVKSNIITGAAPNRKTAQKYQAVSDEEVREAMFHRIDSILYNAAIMEDEIIILGAFGCGVFGNDLQEVSSVFRDLLHGMYNGNFRKAVFAVPDQKSFDIMSRVLKGESL